MSREPTRSIELERCRRTMEQEPIAPIEYKVASTRSEREAAFRLTYDSYLRAGLTSPNPHGLRVTSHHLLPSTDIFLAKLREVAICTFTFVADSPFGLPMEAVYEREVRVRREKGIPLAEITSLADRRSHPTRFLPVLLQLFRLMAQYARRRRFDELLMAVHPAHTKFYQRFLACEPIGQQQSYPAVQNHPAIAMSLNFERVQRERHDDFARFLGDPIDATRLQPRPIDESDRRYFSAMLVSEVGRAREATATG